MAVRIGNVTFDCANPERLARFWAAVMDYTFEGSDERYAACVDPAGSGPRLLFNVVPEPKTVKNRVHLDLNVGDMEAEVERLVGLGARKIKTFHENGETWTVMADLEGNEFCVQPE